MALNMVRRLTPGVVRYPVEYAVGSASRSRRPLVVRTFCMGQLRDFNQSIASGINGKQEQCPLLDGSHEYREGSFIPPANYRVPAKNLGHSPESKASLRKMEPETKYESRPLNPNIYSPSTSGWHLFKPVPKEGSLSQGESLRVVFWNIYCEDPDLESRGSSAMAHLKEIFGDSPTPIVIILQGVHHRSLEAICENPWVRENFVLSNVAAPQPCFTLVMASREIQVESWFRVASPLERDALVVDVPISSL